MSGVRQGTGPGLTWVPLASGAPRPALEIFNDSYFTPMSPRELAAAQGAELPSAGPGIDHDVSAIAEHRRRIVAGINDAMPNPFAAPTGKPANVMWLSPPCEHHSKGGR